MLYLSKQHCNVIDVVDIGAMDVDHDKDLFAGLQNRSTISFEPNKTECNKLVDRGINALPYFIGDGQEHVFNEGAHPMTSSFFEPDIELMELFNDLANYSAVVNRTKEQTVKLDDVKEIGNIDLLKVDAQGSEVDILLGASRFLKETLVIHTEVCFIPIYKNMPLFADIDQTLRRYGFLFHKFYINNLCGRSFKPMTKKDDRFAPISQQMWTDVIYVKDFTKLSLLTEEKLLKLAIILNDVYRSYDFAHYVLSKIGMADDYRKRLTKGMTDGARQY